MHIIYCDLGYCPYAELYAAQAYELSCDGCFHYVQIDEEEDSDEE